LLFATRAVTDDGVPFYPQNRAKILNKKISGRACHKKTTRGVLYYVIHLWI